MLIQLEFAFSGNGAAAAQVEAATLAGRTATTLWQLLQWCYRRQMVQYDAPRLDRPGMPSQAGCFASLAALGLFEVDRGSPINTGGCTAHEDAHTVHDRLMRMAAVRTDGGERLLPRPDLIVRTAERGLPPDWDPEIPQYRVVPSWRGQGGYVERVDGELVARGKVRMLYRSGRPIASLIEFEGVDPAEAERERDSARKLYGLWWSMLQRLRASFIGDQQLKRWKITGVGASREPWSESALTRESCVDRLTDVTSGQPAGAAGPRRAGAPRPKILPDVTAKPRDVVSVRARRRTRSGV